MTETSVAVEQQAQETADQLKATVDRALGSVTQVSKTVDQAKAAVDETLESLKGMVHEMVERVHPVAELLEHVQHNPWLMLGSAVLLGYVLGSLAREQAASR